MEFYTRRSFFFMKQILRTLLNLLFPPICVRCKREGDFLCAGCAKNIVLLDRQVCPVCRKESLTGSVHGRFCRSKTSLCRLLVAASYHKNPGLKQAIRRFKYSGTKELSLALSSLLCRVLEENIPDLKQYLLVPIPLFRDRSLWRGFNQAELLAEQISHQTGIPVGLLIQRIRHTAAQAKLGRHERLINLANAFALDEKASDPTVRNKKILLVDDVSSTLSTLDEAAKVLLRNGFSDVSGLVLARG